MPSPLGTILLILKRKRPFLYGKMAIFSTLRCIFLSIGGDRNNNTYLFVRPGPCLIEWYGCCAFDLLSLKVKSRLFSWWVLLVVLASRGTVQILRFGTSTEMQGVGQISHQTALHAYFAFCRERCFGTNKVHHSDRAAQGFSSVHSTPPGDILNSREPL